MVVAERDAIAVVRPEGYRPVNGDPVLWLLFVKSSGRGNGIGKAFVMNLRRRFEQSMPMILVCNGTRRESFSERAIAMTVRVTGSNGPSIAESSEAR